jgi:hypothetical protein
LHFRIRYKSSGVPIIVIKGHVFNKSYIHSNRPSQLAKIPQFVQIVRQDEAVPYDKMIVA